MGLLDFVNKIKAQESLVENKRSEMLTSNPRFNGMNPSKIEFQPIDGDVDRMTLYGCYKGDKFIYEGKTYTVEKNDVSEITLTPVIDRSIFKGREDFELSKSEKKKLDQLVADGKRRMYLGDFKVGDKIEDGNFRLKYEMREYEVQVGRDDYDTRQKYGLSIQYVNHTNPAKDVVMPDEYFGTPVVFADECFKEAINVASVKHISEQALSQGYIHHMFDGSGLRELPEQLLNNIKTWPNSIQRSCGQACALQRSEEISNAIARNSYLFPTSMSGLDMYSLETERKYTLDKLRENMAKDIDSVISELPKFEKFEAITFMYKFQPTTVYRAVDFDGNCYALNPTGPEKGHYYANYAASTFSPFESYMKKYDSKDIQNLNTGSPAIQPIQGEKIAELIKKAYAPHIETAEERYNKAVEERKTLIAAYVRKADYRQSGLDFKPRGNDDFGTKDEQAKDSHDENR